MKVLGALIILSVVVAFCESKPNSDEEKHEVERRGTGYRASRLVG